MTQLTIDHKDKLCPISRSGRLTWLRGTLGTTPSPSGYVRVAAVPSAQESLSVWTLLPELRETHTSQEVLTQEVLTLQEVLTPRGPHGAVDYPSQHGCAPLRRPTARVATAGTPFL